VNLDTLLLCIVMILFPILVNVLHKLYLKNYDKEENDLFFDITLISCLYLFTGLDLNNAGLLVTMNTVFLLALVKKRKFSSFIIFLFIFINYTEKGILNSYITMFQYSLIYVLYFILIKLKPNV